MGFPIVGPGTSVISGGDSVAAELRPRVALCPKRTGVQRGNTIESIDLVEWLFFGHRAAIVHDRVDSTRTRGEEAPPWQS